MSLLSVSTNLSSKVATRSINHSSQKITNSTRKLATGSRVNKAGDDVAALSIGAKLDTQLRGNDVSLTSTFTMNEGGQSVTRDTVDAFFVNRDLTNNELTNVLNAELAELQAELQALESTENYDQDEADTLRSRITIKEAEIDSASF